MSTNKFMSCIIKNVIYQHRYDFIMIAVLYKKTKAIEL